MCFVNMRNFKCMRIQKKTAPDRALPVPRKLNGELHADMDHHVGAVGPTVRGHACV